MADAGHDHDEAQLASSPSDWVAAIRAGNYAKAWDICRRDLEARDPLSRDDPALPYHLRWVWDGRDFRGRHCLVRCYHGLGDTIQFARYLPRLAALCASLQVEAQPSLVNLLKTMPQLRESDVRITPFYVGRPLPPSQCDIEITELPFALRATPGDVSVPYLSSSHAILPPGTIGLCHGAGDWDAERSIPPDLFAPLCLSMPCITLATEPVRIDVLNPAGCPADMDATAALVMSCDLIITVDTMIAHLAGALGKQTWLLLKADPDWRWPVAGHSTPWYPTIRLYHQARPGEWRDPMAQVAHDLSILSLLSAKS